MRIAVVAAAVCLSIVGLSQADDAKAAMRLETHIPPESLGVALKSFAQDRNLQILYFSDAVRDLHTGGAVGQLTTDEALTQLLSGTGLTYRYVSDKAITILPASGTAGGGGAPNSPSSGPPTTSAEQKEGKTDSSSAFLLAQAASRQAASAVSVEQKNAQVSPQKAETLQEIIVTAQKREERLIDTPQTVTVLSSSDLTRLAATQFADFASTIPGLSFTTAGAGFTSISLRGVTTGSDIGPTVGVYVDEVPYGSSTAFAYGSSTRLDFGLFDLDRIEVLSGPQGTLYGASTMGGLLKYVTRRPDTTSFTLDAQSGISGTQNGGVNYSVSSTANMPVVADKLAVRVNGYESHDGGYIDDVARNQREVNRGDIYGGRIDVVILPIDRLSIRITGALQNISRDGETTADYTLTGAMPYGSLGQYRSLPEPFNQRFQLVSGTVTYDFGPATLTWVSSYQTVRSDNVWDISAVYAPLLNSLGFGPYSAVGLPNKENTSKFTQEVRLAGQKTGSVQWLLGGFYTHESSNNSQYFTLFDPAGNPAPNPVYNNFGNPSTYEEYAGFGDLTWYLTERFDVTGGVRVAHNNQVFTQYGAGVFISTEPTGHSGEGVTTYLGDARYKLTENQTAYVRYATGYRPGGPNLAANDPVTGLPLGPRTFKSDTLKSYEAGYKAETADRKVGIGVAAYYIDWSDIQVQAFSGGFAYKANAPGGATVRGAELTVTARPIAALTLSGAFAYEDAHLSKAVPEIPGTTDGERLPTVPDFTAGINGEYVIEQGGVQPTIGASFRYVANRSASFTVPYTLPSYTLTDLHAGIVVRSVALQLYVHNVFDERAQLSSMWPQFGNRIAIQQPRTIGATATARF